MKTGLWMIRKNRVRKIPLGLRFSESEQVRNRCIAIGCGDAPALRCEAIHAGLIIPFIPVRKNRWKQEKGSNGSQLNGHAFELIDLMEFLVFSVCNGAMCWKSA